MAVRTLLQDHAVQIGDEKLQGKRAIPHILARRRDLAPGSLEDLFNQRPSSASVKDPSVTIYTYYKPTRVARTEPFVLLSDENHRIMLGKRRRGGATAIPCREGWALRMFSHRFQPATHLGYR